jgi:hypothetical protein
VKRTNGERLLAAALVAYIICDVLLTPPAGLETRNPAFVTSLGVATLALLFVGLALSIVALILIARGSSRSTIIAVVAAVLYFPAPIAEAAGHFSSLPPPTAIAWLEVLQALVAVVVIVIGGLVLRRRVS